MVLNAAVHRNLTLQNFWQVLASENYFSIGSVIFTTRTIFADIDNVAMFAGPEWNAISHYHTTARPALPSARYKNII